MSTYPGGKGGAGVYQRLINEIPPHDVYIAAFAGHDAICQHKRPARRTILVDLEATALEWWAEYSDDPGLELHLCDAVTWLRVTFGLTSVRPVERDPAAVDRAARYRKWFVYLDPPYLMSTRSGGRLYSNELDDAGHASLLEVALQLPCPTMICGYPSKLYDRVLRSWRRFEYYSTTRSGERRLEAAWCNYGVPSVLHDSRFVGSDKREREKVRRRIRRLAAKLDALAPHERQAVLDSVATHRK